jgi:hypothetical protein
MRIGWWRRIVGAAVVLAIGVACGVAFALMPAAGEPPGIELVGKVPANPQLVKATIVDTSRHQLLMLSNDAATGGAPINVTTIDGDTLAVVRTLSIPDYKLPGGSASTPVPYAWDQASRRLYLGVLKPPAGAAFLPLSADTLVTLEAGERVVGSPLPLDPATFSPGVSFFGMSYSAAAGRLYVEGAVIGGSAGATAVQVNEVNPSTAKPTWSAPYTVPSCETPVATTAQAAVARPNGQAVVYLGCGSGNIQYSYSEPGLPAMAKVDFTDPQIPTTTLYPVPGSYATGDSLYDAEGGRFIMVSQGLGQPTQAVWVFDIAHGTFLGNISAGNAAVSRPALSATGGRLYVPVSGALLIASDRGLKIGQATSYPWPGLNSVAASMPFNRTIVAHVNASYYAYRVNADPYVAPPIPDPDAATVDFPEGPTAPSSFGGDAKAFGMRVHQVGGLHSAQQNSTAFGPYFNSDLFALTKSLANSFGGPAGVAVFPFNDNDRDIYASRIGATRLSLQEASASAVTADADPYTQGDYRVASGSNTSWPYEKDFAHCADFGKAETGVATAAETKCDRAGGTVTANVSNGTPTSVASNEAPFGTGQSSASASIVRDAKSGVVVDTIATAKDVNIGPAHFGEIVSVAHATAHGRPGTAHASYTRQFKNVSLGDFACTDQCDPREVANQLGAALGSRFQVELPGDDTLGTARGARGQAFRDAWQHQQDVALNNQAETEVQVPALRVIYYNDNSTRSRVIFEWAGTFADANYRIYRVPQADVDLEDVTAGSALGGSGDDLAALGTITYLSDGTILTIDPAAGPGTPYAVLQYAAHDARQGLLLGHALRLLFTGRRAVILSSLLWGLLLTPAFLAGRRRYLLRTIGDTQ